MKRGKNTGKRIVAVLFSAVLAVGTAQGAFPVCALAQEGSKDAAIKVTSHRHTVCTGSECTDDSHGEIQWTPWNSSTDSLPADAGNWYLTEDIQLTDEWRPADGTSLCLNGHMVTAAEGSKKVIVISSGVSFSLCDCAETAGKLTKGYGGVENQGTFTMYGGEISGNKLGSAGGVRNQGTFIMYGGKICNNEASTYRGGGVYNVTDGTFTMYGGEISGNRNPSTISMCGGGGVCTEGIFSMYGGVITKNSSTQSVGGVWICNTGVVKVGGTAVIRDNARGAFTVNNVGFQSSRIKLIIDKNNPLREGAYIGITGNTGETFTEENDRDYSQYFHSDMDWCEVVNGENNAVMLAEKHMCYLTYHEAVASTCAKEGTGEYWRCDDIEEEDYGVVFEGCGKMYSDEEGAIEIMQIPTLPKEAHSYNTSVWKLDDASHWYECSSCGDKRDTAAHTEDKGTVTKQPTETEKGSRIYHCTVCQKELRTEEIPVIQPDTEGGEGDKDVQTAVTGVTLNKVNSTLTKAGETIRLTASVSPADATNKKVTWKSSNTRVATVDGSGKVTAVGNGICTITATTEDGNKTAACRVTVSLASKTDVPEQPGSTVLPVISKEEQEKNALFLNAKLKVSQTGKKINVVWGKLAEADGYDVYVQYCGKKFSKKSITAIKSGNTTKVRVKRVNGKTLNVKKNYKIYVLAYRFANGKKVTLARTITAHIVGKNNKKYTNVKAVKVKKRAYTLKKGKTAKIRAKTVLVKKRKKQLTKAHAKQFRYASTNKKIAKVSAKGKIKAVGKGTCSIYVYARNGYAKKIKVKVK